MKVFSFNKPQRLASFLTIISHGKRNYGKAGIKEYLLSCSRYIELNPVRAGLVEDPSAFQRKPKGNLMQ